MKNLNLKKYIRDIPDFPKMGILFKDITTLLKDKKAFKFAVDKMAAKFRGKKIDTVVAVEARGFILGGAIAHAIGAGLCRYGKEESSPGGQIP